MALTPQQQIFILGGLIVVGFAVFGWLVFDLGKKVKIIFGGGESKDVDFQKDLLRRLTRVELKLQELEPRINLLEEISKLSVQKVGFLRFNPFNDTGGNNSFVAVLLDRENNGLLITSLYMREGMRLYAKKVVGGKTQQQLSEEEERVLKDTITQNSNIRNQN